LAIVKLKTLINSVMLIVRISWQMLNVSNCRLASIGLLKRLSDACAYVQNPFAAEVK
jgi:hypothetical protein